MVSDMLGKHASERIWGFDSLRLRKRKSVSKPILAHTNEDLQYQG